MAEQYAENGEKLKLPPRKDGHRDNSDLDGIFKNTDKLIPPDVATIYAKKKPKKQPPKLPKLKPLRIVTETFFPHK
jgi:hypothetical protein